MNTRDYSRIGRRLALALLASAPLFAQCPTGTLYPGALDTNSSLTVAKNNLITTLTVNQQIADTVAIVASTTGWTANMMAAVDTGVAIEYEYVTSVSGQNTLNVSRACESSVAVVHLAGAPVDNNATAYSGHTSVAGAAIAIETALGANLANIPGSPSGGTVPINKGGTGQTTQTGALNAILGTAGVTTVQGNGDTKVELAGTNSGTVGAPLCNDANGGATTSGCVGLPAGTQLQYLRIQPNTGNNTTTQFAAIPGVFYATDYVFPVQTPGGSLIVGNTSITMTPVPQGVNGSDVGHRLYVSAGTGTAEACLITGGTGTAGQASGAIIINCANTHSGAWTIQSACGGAQEAIQAAGSGTVFFPAGTYSCQGTITVSAANMRITGQRGAIIQAAANAGLTYLLQTTNAATGFTLDNVTLDGNRANGGTIQNPAAAGNAKNLFAVLQIGGAHSTVSNAEIRLGQVFGITLQDASIAPSDFKLYNSYIHDNGGTLTSTGFGNGIIMGNPSTTIDGVEITGNHFENNYNTVTGPGPSAAINAFNTNNVQVTGNYAKNNFNVVGGQYVTGSTTGASCSGNNSNWTLTGNTAILTTQFGSDITFGIEVCGQLQTIVGNTLIGNDRGGILTDAGSTDLTIVGNYIDGNGNKETPSLSSGISFGGAGATPALRMVVVGNTLKNYDWGLSNQFATNDFLLLRDNILTSNTTPVADTSTQTHVFISENLGFNPQAGATGTITVTASPFTYTAAHIPESIAITGGTTTHISINGVDMCTTTPCFFRLEPNQSTTVTYSVAPTMVKTIQ